MRFAMFIAGAGLGLIAAVAYAGYGLFDEIASFDPNVFNE